MTNASEMTGTVDRELTWVKVKGELRTYRLEAPDGGVAELRFEKAFGTLATLTTARGVWTFKRVRFFSPTITVRRAGSDEDLAAFKFGWSGAGELRWASGAVRTFRRCGFMRPEWSFLTEAGEELVQFGPAKGFWCRSTTVRPGDAPETEPGEIEVLMGLGFYLLLASANDTGAGSTAAVVACCCCS